MKKQLSCMLVIVFLMTTFLQGMVFATGESAADLLYKYDFISGDNGDLMVDQNLTRAQACVLLSEMYGKKSEASKYIFIQNFTDVGSKDWFAPYVTYAKTQKWISGYPDGTFKPNNSVTKQEWSAMLMNALGYTYKWENVILDMNTIGIDFSVANASSIKRGEAFEGMWSALLTPPSGETKALVLKLGKVPDGIIDIKDDTPVVDTSGSLDVVSYRAVGLTELEFVFNKPIKVAENNDMSKFKLSQETNFFLRPINAMVTEDGKGLRLVTNVPIGQNKEMNITLSNIEATDGSVMKEKKLVAVKFIDSGLPQMMKAEIAGDYYIKVTFNEPVQSDEDYAPLMDSDDVPELSISDFIVNNGDVNLKSVTLSDNNKIAIIQTHTKLTDNVEITAKNTIKDYAGFNLYSTKIKAEYIKDVTPPKVVGARAVNSKQVIIIWDENLKLITKHSSQYYHESLANSIDYDLTDDDINGNEMTLDFSSKPLSSGTNTLYIMGGSVSDYFGNLNETQTIKVELEKDTTSPTLISEPKVENEKTVILSFSEALRNQNNELFTKSNYELLDSKKSSTAIGSVTYDSQKEQVTLRFNEKLSGEYTLVLKNIYDLAGNALVDGGHSFSVQDMSIPDSSDWTAKVFYTTKSETDIIVFYNEPMSMTGNYSVLDKSNYRVNGRDLSQLPNSAVSIKAIDNQTVQITIATKAYDGMDVVADSNSGASSNDLTVGKVADVSGNVTETNENYIDLNEKSYVNVLGFRYIGNNQCEILLSEKVVDVDLSDFEVVRNGKNYSLSDYFTSEDDEGRTIITVTINDNMNSNLGYFLSARGQNTKTAFGETFDPYAPYVQLTEYVGGGLEKITLNGNYIDNVYYTESTGIITLVFSKTLNTNSVFLMTFEVPGVEIDQILATGAFVQIYVNSKDWDDVDKYMSIIQNYPMKDSDGIEINDINTRIEYFR